jgi:hypothetical protein
MLYALGPIGIRHASDMVSKGFARQPMVAYVMMGVVAVLGFLCVSGAVASTTKRAQGGTKR